ncbi:MAG: protein kinase [Verrucomicrobia bacterium]|nr:protein kinase [Verrucomicrobiota bacterium]
MPESIEGLRAEIERLRREYEELSRRVETRSSPDLSIRGVETFVMRIGPDERILYINSAFARHAGVSRADIIGKEAKVLRRFLNPELFVAIARPEEGGSLVRLTIDDRGRAFEVKTTLHKGMLDVVMEDVTDEHQFRNLVQRYVLKDFDVLSDEELRTFRFPERRFMSVSFTDLRGFTQLVEALAPEEVRGMINAYFEEVIRVVEANGATAAQLVGDGLMAFYGAPRYFKDHAFRSIKTACEQIEKVDELCARYERVGKRMCRCGVGISAGEVVLGNMGSASRQAYTAFGSSVNLASRLCDAALEGQILLTEVVLNSALETLPADWEVIESRSVAAHEIVTSAGGKIEDVQELPEDLKGKVLSIGPGVRAQSEAAEFIFRYLYLLKPKGIAKSLPVITVERMRGAQSIFVLNDERMPPQQAEIMIGKYRLLEPIGEGGMGKVWKVRDQFGNIVAIKMLKAGEGASSHQLERFKREAAIMARLSHRNICHIHEIGEAEGVIYIAMEFVDGASLAEVIYHGGDATPVTRSPSKPRRSGDLSDLIAEIKEGRKTASENRSTGGTGGSSNTEQKPLSSSSLPMLPTQRVLALVSAVSDAIQFAHEHGVFHRDLKPANIMIRPDGEPVVMDFGLAKVEAQRKVGEVSISIEGQIVGTIEYMAPEQAHASKQVTERADVYSLGAILYQLLTGKKHFQSSGSLLHDLEMLRDHVPVAPRRIKPAIDKDLETIALKALQADPARRYPSVRQMREDIRRYQEGDPITARRPTIAYRLVTFVRKNRVAFSFWATIFLLGLLFGAYTYSDWRKQWGDWTEAMDVDFSKSPDDPGQGDWLKERFIFENPQATSEVEPWSVNHGAMVMRQHEWCWLKKVQMSADSKVVVDLRFSGQPEAFQICINSKRRLRQSENDPPGYSCRFGIWGGSLDLIAKNDLDRKGDLNSLLVSSTPQKISDGETYGPNENAAAEKIVLTFQRQGDTVSLLVNGKEAHREVYLMPLIGQHDPHSDRDANYESIGIRTWGRNVEVLRVRAFRFKLPEKASPIVAGDTLVESGYLDDALRKYKTIASDYQTVSSSIAALALTKGYLLAAQLTDSNVADEQLNYFLGELRRPVALKWWQSIQGDARKNYLGRVREIEALIQWNKEMYQKALGSFPVIFKANPASRIVIECLQSEHKPLEPRVSEELLGWTAKTFARAPELAGLDINSFQITNLDPLKSIRSLRSLDCSRNQLTSLDPLKNMVQLRALYCGQNYISTLEPLNALSLIELYCDDNRIEALEPLRPMLLLERLYCGSNQIKSLLPLKGKPLYALDCSFNKITSLDAIADLHALEELYCASNQIRSLEPLRNSKNLHYLDCRSNAIESLEPLKDLDLYSLDCSGNRILALDPYIDSKNPPAEFIFDCDTLPDAQLERAQSAWSAKGLNSDASYCELLLALRHNDLQRAKRLASDYGGHRYLFFRNRLSAADAKQFCARLGGHLVTITSESENAFLRQIVPTGTSCRIGLIVLNGKPQWVTDESAEKHFVPPLTDFRFSDRIVTWKDGTWLPLSSKEDKPMPFIVEWD